MGSLIEELQAAGGGSPGRGGPAAQPDRGAVGGPGQGGGSRSSRLAITREEVTRVLEEPAAAEPPAGQDGAPAGRPRPAPPIGAVTVPPWQEGAEASVLPQSYQDLLEVAADAGRPLRAGEFAAAAGLSTDKAKVEGLRSKLKLLAVAGLAGRGRARRPVHAARITQGNMRNRRTGDGLFFLVIGSLRRGVPAKLGSAGGLRVVTGGASGVLPVRWPTP